MAKTGLGQDRLAHRPGFLVRRLHQIFVSIYLQHCEQFGTTPAQSSVMQVLAARPGIDQATLAAEIGLDRTTTSNVLHRLQQRGIIRRETDKADRRSRRAFLTPVGETMLQEMRSSIAAAHRQLTEPLSKDDREHFVSMLQHLVAANNSLGRTTLRDL